MNGEKQVQAYEIWRFLATSSYIDTRIKSLEEQSSHLNELEERIFGGKKVKSVQGISRELMQDLQNDIKESMQEIYKELKDTQMLVLAAPIYYHGISGQLKCVIDRFYSALYPTAPKSLKKAAMFLSSGDPDMYDGAKFSYEGDFLGYLGLEGCGIFTNHDMDVMDRIRKMASSL